MTRSIFDPTGPDAEHGGTRNLGAEADNISHVPSDVIDGKVEQSDAPEEEQDTATRQIAKAASDVAKEREKQNPDAGER
jgi:hypothetical protein